MGTKRVGRIRTRQQRLPLDQPELDLGDLTADVPEPETVVADDAGEDIAVNLVEPETPAVAAEIETPVAPVPEPVIAETEPVEANEPAVTETEPDPVEAVETEADGDESADVRCGDSEPKRLKIDPAIAEAATTPVQTPAPKPESEPAVSESRLAVPERSRPASRRMKRVPTPKPFVARAFPPTMESSAEPATPAAEAAPSPVQDQTPEPETMQKKLNIKKPAAVAAPTPEPETADTLGAALRQAREAAGYSVPQVAELSHIRMDYVKALESDDHSRLPAAAIYTKSYIKSLCRQYRIDPEPLLAQYENQAGKPVQPTGSQSAAPAEEYTPLDSVDVDLDAPVAGISTRHLAWAAAAALAIVLTVLVIGMGKRLLTSTPTETVAGITNEQIAELLPPPVVRLRELEVHGAR